MTDGNMWTKESGDIDCLSTEILRAILVQDLNSETSEMLSPETIKYIVKLIRKREEESETHEEVNVTAAWSNFKAQHLSHTTMEEKMPDNISGEEFRQIESSSNGSKLIRRHSIAFRRFIAIAATIGILFASMLVAQAAGIDVLGAIGRWTDETFHFVTSPTKATQDGGSLSSTSANYASLQAALNDCGITEMLAPTWFPEGFELSEQKIISNDSGNIISYYFSDSGQKVFTIQIIRVNSTSDIEAYIFEKDDTSVEQYISGEKTFYFLSNLGNQTATWSDGISLAMIILGNISEDDIKSMINSIGGPQL